MAKAKKTEKADDTGGKPAEKKKTAAKKSAARKTPAVQSGSPLIDTSFAAEAAAKMIANRGKAEGAEAGQKESDSFKQLKQSLNKPKGTLTNPLLANVQGQKKGNQPFLGGQQVGRNQTFGADVNRTGVPRRTSG